MNSRASDNDAPPEQPGRHARRKRNGPVVKPVQRALGYSIRVLQELVRLQRALYFVSLGTAEGDPLDWLNSEVVESSKALIGVRHQMPGWLEETRAHYCVRTTEQATQEIGRLAFRLRRNSLQIVTTWLLPLAVKLDPSAMPGNPVANAFRMFPSGAPPREFLVGLRDYLERIDLPSLLSMADMLVAQVNVKFVPSAKEQQIYDILKQNGPLKKDQLLERVGGSSSDLYDVNGKGLSRMMDYGIVEHVPNHGYVVAGELPNRLPRRRRTRSR